MYLVRYHSLPNPSMRTPSASFAAWMNRPSPSANPTWLARFPVTTTPIVSKNTRSPRHGASTASPHTLNW
jgi:hypothetical protein